MYLYPALPFPDCSIETCPKQGIQPPESLLKAAALSELPQPPAAPEVTARPPRLEAMPPRDFFAGLPSRVFPASTAVERALDAVAPTELHRPPAQRPTAQRAVESSRVRVQTPTAAIALAAPSNIPQGGETEPVEAGADVSAPSVAVENVSASEAREDVRGPDADLLPSQAAPGASPADPRRVPSGPYVSPLLRRIATARRWQDLKSVIERQPRDLDAAAVVSALSRLSEILPGGISQLQGTNSSAAVGVVEDTPASLAVGELATELMSLLQLQLPRLPGHALAAAVGAAGKLGARPPRSAWLSSALGACQSRMSRSVLPWHTRTMPDSVLLLFDDSGCLFCIGAVLMMKATVLSPRMSSAELLSSVSGLSALAAEPNAFWMKALFTDTRGRMEEGGFTLGQLGKLAAAIAGEYMSIVVLTHAHTLSPPFTPSVSPFIPPTSSFTHPEPPRYATPQASSHLSARARNGSRIWGRLHGRPSWQLSRMTLPTGSNRQPTTP